MYSKRLKVSVFENLNISNSQDVSPQVGYNSNKEADTAKKAFGYWSEKLCGC